MPDRPKTPKRERAGKLVLFLALEIFVLVFVVCVLGFAAGFAGGKLRHRIRDRASVAPAEADGSAGFEEFSYNSEPASFKRIPDPAPPSESRRRRLVDGVPHRQ